ncbi:MAG: sugar phosphate isomerase/epimerase family protein [Planctomycetota bacterium]
MKITWSLFPKFYAHLDPRGLAELVREAGLDAVNLVIREGYWVTPSGVADEAPRFVEAVRKGGVRVPFATAGFDLEDLARGEAPLGVLADCGIRDFRPGYFRRPEAGAPVRELIEGARATMERIARVCERSGTRCVYQLHHGTLFASASSVWPLVKGLPHEAVGVELDPGNQSREGFEGWDRSCSLLGEYVAAAGIKDSAPRRDDSRTAEPAKGWRQDWVPCDEGVTDWHAFARALRAIDFAGTFVFMPFYHQDEPDEMTRALRREVAYVKGAVAEATGRTEE